MKPLDHYDMLAHCGLGAVVTLICAIFHGSVVMINYPGEWKIAIAYATVSIMPSSWMGALVIIYREVIQDSMWCEIEYPQHETGWALDPQPKKRYRAFRGLRFLSWGRQKHYETWPPAAFTVLWGTALGVWIT